jgi:hypothetical protein
VSEACVTQPSVIAPELDASDGAGAGHRVWLVILAVAAVATPFVISLVALLTNLGDPTRPWGDNALIETSVRAVGARSVLLGPFSQWGWRHPGPLYFYLLAGPYRLLGSSYSALLVGPVLVGAASAVGIVLLSARRGGPMLALWASAVVLAFLGATGELAVDVWNPWVTMLPFAFALIAAWTLGAGELWALPLFAGLATFVVQTHLGYAPVLSAAGLLAVISVVWTTRRDVDTPNRWQPLRRTIVWTLALLALLWLAPALEQLLHDPGNARDVAAFFGSAEGEHSLSDGVDAAATYIAAIPARVVDGAGIFDAAGRSATAWPTIVSVLGLVAAGVTAWWRRHRSLAVLVMIVIAAWLVAIVSVSRIVGTIEEYLLDWIAAIGIPLWIAVGLAVLVAAKGVDRTHVPGWARVTAAVLTTLVLGALVAHTFTAFRDVDDPDPTSVMATRLTDAVRSELPRDRSVPVVIRVREDPELTPWAAGILDGLDADGRDVRIERSRRADVILWPWERTTATRGATVVTLRPDRPGQPAAARIGDIAIDVDRPTP